MEENQEAFTEKFKKDLEAKGFRITIARLITGEDVMGASKLDEAGYLHVMYPHAIMTQTELSSPASATQFAVIDYLPYSEVDDKMISFHTSKVLCIAKPSDHLVRYYLHMINLGTILVFDQNIDAIRVQNELLMTIINEVQFSIMSNQPIITSSETPAEKQSEPSANDSVDSVTVKTSDGTVLGNNVLRFLSPSSNTKH